jgi:tRNA nucleotidyltransferase/poly(A) polymerase
MKAKHAAEIVRTLRENGHEAYFVGGCVRDMVMEIEPTDYDIATSARPEEVIEIFPRTEPIGVQFGVVLVVLGGLGFEVATFRSDEAYVDGRRPSGVVFTTAKEDVLRRDFTINGLLYDPIEKRITDHVDGRADIERRVVRAIGNPHERFEEDKLRILRAIRFGARLGYSIEDETWTAVLSMASKINQISAERIRDELLKILVEGDPGRGLRMLEESGLRQEILPELSWTDHLQKCMALIEGPVGADFAMGLLLHECPVKHVDRISLRLKLSNAERAHVRALVANQSVFDQVLDMETAPLKRFLRIDRFADHIELRRLHRTADGGDLEALEFVREKLGTWSETDLWPEALISGDDLIRLGMEPGPSFREILTLVEDEQLEQRLVDRDGAIRFVRQRFGVE